MLIKGNHKYELFTGYWDLQFAFVDDWPTEPARGLRTTGALQYAGNESKQLNCPHIIVVIRTKIYLVCADNCHLLIVNFLYFIYFDNYVNYWL